jgi:minor curlin subunit
MRVRSIAAAFGGLVLGGLVLAVGPANAQQLVYTPVNPQFGGNPFNATQLEADASAQNQLGSHNDANLAQSGDVNVMTLVQSGSNNRASASQTAAGAGLNVAAMTQVGTGDAATLTQDGGYDTAIQTQVGSNDTQSVTQVGAGNEAAYTQIGSNLPDLGVVETGGMHVSIVQSASPFAH